MACPGRRTLSAMTGDPGGDPGLVQLVETWRAACADFVALARTLPREEWDLPTDLEGWSVKDNVAHTAHLEAVLAGAPEETLEVPEAPHLTGLMSYYTEQGVLARRDHDMGALVAEIEQSVTARYTELLAEPPTDPDGSPPRTPGGVGWSTRTLLSNRPLDVWMHEQDIRRATGRPGGYDSVAAAHVLRVFGHALPMVVGKRVAPPEGSTVRLHVPAAGLSWTVQVGPNGRAAPVDETAEPTTAVTLTPEELVVLAGGRRTPAATAAVVQGDQEIGKRVLESLAVTS
jgi:uncharacterized protein (TIGR03083 family)